MPPVHVSPHIIARVMLVKQMVATVDEHQAVGVIHPVRGRREMIRRAILLRSSRFGESLVHASTLSVATLASDLLLSDCKSHADGKRKHPATPASMRYVDWKPSIS